MRITWHNGKHHCSSHDKHNRQIWPKPLISRRTLTTDWLHFSVSDLALFHIYSHNLISNSYLLQYVSFHIKCLFLFVFTAITFVSSGFFFNTMQSTFLSMHIKTVSFKAFLVAFQHWPWFRCQQHSSQLILYVL